MRRVKELEGLLKDKKSLYLTLILSICYILPLIVANYEYLDDYGRNLHGYGWQHDGRYLATFLGKIWSVNSSIFSIFPFSTILSALILGFTGYILSELLEIEKGKLIRWTPLLILTMPTFLGNLVFKFDCLPMALSLFLIVFPFVFYNSWKVFFVISIIGVFLSFGLYQSSATCYFMVGSIFLIREILANAWKLFFYRFFLMMVSFIIAFLCYILILKLGDLQMSDRTETIFGTLFFDSLVANKNLFTERLVTLLYTGNYRYLISFFIITNLIGIVYYFNTSFKKLFIILSVLAILVINVCLISGVNILLKNTYWDLRTFCGLGFFLLNVSFFQKYLKSKFIDLARISSFVIIFFSFVLMAQFGRVLKNQTEFQNNIAIELNTFFKEKDIKKVAFIGTLRIASRNEFIYNKFPLFTNLLSSPIGQYSAWTKEALNYNGRLNSIEVIDGSNLLCQGLIIEENELYTITQVDNETLLIDFNKNNCN
ncbi:glucosyltransferase domain-containing protein [Paenimyroides aestuarii]|uniref:Glucosyltransferase domain-containing protein n=1 Tax=Paenimyroides aestuarii TaxID=2968490 RepID=A0ABY5NNW4_9FLAO|nr:glucosyltransferase domain-containing protein [Paenimyroides aestuarii]UUV20203.1 glucosyltransferase domain-containing protein [Paenimyroides aestuarii]